MKSRLMKALVITGAVLANLAFVAGNASAGFKDSMCSDGEGGAVRCCVPCYFFCECTIIHE